LFPLGLLFFDYLENSLEQNQAAGKLGQMVFLGGVGSLLSYPKQQEWDCLLHHAHEPG
jgi:hypothetical protein